MWSRARIPDRQELRGPHDQSRLITSRKLDFLFSLTLTTKDKVVWLGKQSRFQGLSSALELRSMILHSSGQVRGASERAATQTRQCARH